MYWYKVKNLLIIMFAIINLFLVGFIVSGHYIRHSEFNARKTALSNALKTNNIIIDESLFSYDGATVSTASVENLIPRGNKLPETFLKGEYETISEDNIVKYISGSKTVYIDNGKLHYSDKSLTIDKTLSQGSVSTVISLLEQYGIDISSASPAIVGDTIVFVYKLGDLSLFENTLSVKMSGESIAEINGYVISIDKENSTNTEICSVSDILIDLIQDPHRPKEQITIKSITLGHSLLLADSSVDFKNTETIPTYKITTDNNISYFYDARR